MSTVIANPRLQELFDAAYDYAFQMGLKDNHGGIPVQREAFILALNERLAAAEKMAEAALHLISTGSGSSDLMEAVTAYRRLAQEHHMACLTVVTGGLEGPCDCKVSQ